MKKKIGETVKLKNQKKIIYLKHLNRKKFNDLLKQIKEEQKTIDINFFKNVFNYESPDKTLEYLHSLETTDNYNQVAAFTDKSLADFVDEVKIKPGGNKKNEGKKY